MCALNKGKLIYREQSGRIVLYIMMLFGIIFDSYLIAFSGLYQIFTVVMIAIFSILVPIWALNQLDSNPGFYEHGIGWIKHRKLVRWESYDKFVAVGCLIQRYQSNSNVALAFVREDGSAVLMRVKTTQKLVEAWQSILAIHPELKDKLQIVQNTEIPEVNEAYEELYTILKNAN